MIEYRVVNANASSGLAVFLAQGGDINAPNSDGLRPIEVAARVGDFFEFQDIMYRPGFDPQQGDPKAQLEIMRQTLGEHRYQAMLPALESLQVMRAIAERGFTAQGTATSPFTPKTLAMLDRALAVLDSLKSGTPDPLLIAKEKAALAPTPDAPAATKGSALEGVTAPGTSAALERARQFAQQLTRGHLKPDLTPASPAASARPAESARETYQSPALQEAKAEYLRVRTQLQEVMAGRVRQPTPLSEAPIDRPVMPLPDEQAPGNTLRSAYADTAASVTSAAFKSAEPAPVSVDGPLRKGASEVLDRFMGNLARISTTHAIMVPATLGAAVMMAGVGIEVIGQMSLPPEALQAYKNLVATMTPGHLAEYVKAGLAGDLPSIGGNATVRGAVGAAVGAALGAGVSALAQAYTRNAGSDAASVEPPKAPSVESAKPALDEPGYSLEDTPPR